MSDRAEARERNEWRVEVALDRDEQGHSLGERLHSLDLDNEARERLGGSVVVTRDGPRLFIYAWHEESAREAERTVRELMEQDSLAGEVSLTRWHPVAEDWRPADEPVSDTEADRMTAEREAEAAHVEHEHREHPWEVLIDLPDRRATLEFAAKLHSEGLPVKRRWKYVLVGVDTEDAAMELGKRLEGEAPEGSEISVRGNPEDMPLPGFITIGSFKPGFLRDLGI